ncbi:hypothetical protein LJR118_004465 [Acidovorax sp. LjRoot118]|uniref:hypothetical protein n=1 Tax=unclassified Acidovorax TaxID=2684926 RepID=UPI000B324E2C|nr:hypothetical protein [Acidovorax sp. Root217]
MSIDRSTYSGIPADFPIVAIPSALSGAHPKMSLTEEDGKFYAPGTSPSEVATAFEVCEDLVVQMVPYCERKLTAFQGDQEATLRAVYRSLLSKKWCTDLQSEWIVRKTAERLGWHLSPSTLAA